MNGFKVGFVLKNNILIRILLPSRDRLIEQLTREIQSLKEELESFRLEVKHIYYKLLQMVGYIVPENVYSILAPLCFILGLFNVNFNSNSRNIFFMC